MCATNGSDTALSVMARLRRSRYRCMPLLPVILSTQISTRASPSAAPAAHRHTTQSRRARSSPAEQFWWACGAPTRHLHRRRTAGVVDLGQHREARQQQGATTYIVKWRTPDEQHRARGGFATKRAAEAYKTEVESALLKGLEFEPSAGKVTFREAALEWLDSRHDLKATSLAGHRAALAPAATRHGDGKTLGVDAVFGGYPLNKITRPYINAWCRRWSLPASSLPPCGMRTSWCGWCWRRLWRMGGWRATPPTTSSSRARRRPRAGLPASLTTLLSSSRRLRFPRSSPRRPGPTTCTCTSRRGRVYVPQSCAVCRWGM